MIAQAALVIVGLFFVYIGIAGRNGFWTVVGVTLVIVALADG